MASSTGVLLEEFTILNVEVENRRRAVINELEIRVLLRESIGEDLGETSQARALPRQNSSKTLPGLID